MKFSRFAAVCLCAAAPAVSAFAEEGDASSGKTLGRHDPNYDLEATLKASGAARSDKARRDFDESPRESTLRVAVAPCLMFGMTDDVSGGDGWGASASALLQMNSDEPDFKFLLGGELFGFSAKGEDGGRDAELRTLNLMLSAGCAYDFSRYFELGCVLGYGLVGATHFRRDKTGGGDENFATMNTVLSVKPYAEFMLNKNFALFVAYRFVYMAPSLISSAADWGDVTTSASAVEVGFSYRF
ncbi:MAG: outer membrane beta-barrel protein [Candidatus Spyradosoma sp.]